MCSSLKEPFRPLWQIRLADNKFTPSPGTYKVSASNIDDPSSHTMFAVPLKSAYITPPPTRIVLRLIGIICLKREGWSDMWEEAPESAGQVEGCALRICLCESKMVSSISSSSWELSA